MEFIVIVIGVVFTSYLLLIALFFGIQRSISASYYSLKKINKGFIFTLFLFFLMICLLYITALTNHSNSWCFFLAASGAAFVGLAASFYDSVTKIAHFFGASLLIVFSLLGIGLVFSNWTPTYLTILILFIFYLLRNKQFEVIYWFEVLVFIFIITGLYKQ